MCAQEGQCGADDFARAVVVILVVKAVLTEGMFM